MQIKNLFLLLLILTAFKLDAQVYHPLTFVLNPETESEVTYVYPEETSYEVTDAFGNQRSLDHFDKTLLEGPMTVTVYTPWNDRPDVLQTEDGLIIEYGQYEVPLREKVEDHPTRRADAFGLYTSPVQVIEKEIIEEGNEFGLKISFSNGLVFQLIDGEASAYQNGNPLLMTGNFKIQSAEGVLYLSFNKQTAETWYFFESKA